ncbi:N-6 DNA methylase [Staphylococcus epidermidis]|uniref:DNA methyltransferase n=1 Tax=Staphylococcus epidermidis TaxID=1282 RepID=UPI0004A914BB|nr:DNA methyltransferase [Staphylococcus epidermidis]KDP67781.1 methyltransferase domain protein [Staphylococcus epidermidis VCU111]MBM6057809.1 class I SAM-dependent DNA methyltransferase [Staphylococcus epidermidis]MCG1806584.1 N-6 DNA methylase [Staphylococcus epidermidis]MCG2175505.1 N-6 DNA methylase [Staphylococcus epidermidis]MCO6238334.1 N-6 DNA methylase [Staphylococcus epidermidis]
MKVNEQKKEARKFIERWKNRGEEKKDSQSFWLDLLEHVYGIENAVDYITFEDNVLIDKTSFMDGYISKTNVLIEQKSKNKSLKKAIKQSDGTLLTPFQQAKRYSANLPYSKRPRWIITCNFKEFYVYDMENPNFEEEVIRLEDLEKDYYRLDFLIDKNNEHIEKETKVSMKAGEIVGKIYESLLKQYKNPKDPDSLKSINQLCVRIVFCLYAEDSGIFGRKNMFYDYLVDFETRFFRNAIIDLFQVLNTPVSLRDPYLDEKLNEFPYVNGGMFSENNIEIPQFTDELRDLVLNNASHDFDWSYISPTIFGSVFESTLNPEIKREGGMHYTTIQNIHKVIDPLFLNELREELDEIKKTKQTKTLKNKLIGFQKKLSELTFFDPACGSGNFLTETYISIRRLENEAIKLIKGENIILDVEESNIQVHLDQFYGIEINDFAVSVAKTALWIAESQMMEETKNIIYSNEDFLPLKSYTNVIEGNAIEIEWKNLSKSKTFDYILGNPPFVANNGRVSAEEAHSIGTMNEKQKSERISLFGKKGGVLDYVSCWYKKAANYIQNTNTKCAFVSTNSICQGQQVLPLWEDLLENDIKINFAHTSFKWNNDSNKSATVYVVIIGFSVKKNKEPILYFPNGTFKKVKQINPYLIPAENVLIGKRRSPISSDAPFMLRGSQPTDNGNLILTTKEKNELIKEEPKVEQWIRPFSMGGDFIEGKEKYCLWMPNINPKTLLNLPVTLKRVEKVREFRQKSRKKATQKKAETPYRFDEVKVPNSDKYIAVPIVSSGNRKYVPIGFVKNGMIPGNKLFYISDGGLYEFGVLISNVHTAWLEVVGAKYGPSYSYSNTIVYNNFPWPKPTKEQRTQIEKTAQKIIEAREKYKDSTLADMYGKYMYLYPELMTAHQNNDKAVMEAYNFTKIENETKTWLTESETIAELFSLYAKLKK